MTIDVLNFNDFTNLLYEAKDTDIRGKMFKDIDGKNMKTVTVKGVNYNWNSAFRVYNSVEDYSQLKKDVVPDGMSYEVFSKNN